MKKQLFLIIALCAILVGFDQDNKPKVLIIGDSISLGYTPHVKSALKDKANVFHNKGNAQHTGTGIEKLDEWLGDTQWDVIHFNWGLWDLCYRHPDAKTQGNRDKVNGTVTYTPEQYRDNMEALVVRLKQTGAKLIFATTSYVPEGEVGRFVKSDKIYNKMAVEVMKKHGVTINPLNRISKKVYKKHAAGPGNVHYTKEGYRLLSEPVVKYIEKSLGF
ncbi:SGNH/GDSL hydrolase family protein [Zobellia galactanivorans]|uniref:GDSL-like Lipase/Acylhydrolase family n=1 Tax=Zobellia galactanivorans (strain DSM 12802 / CCUG 47099 / CIP 106680 / NCIMB 13871 / Dsij) TaxID=63186 RepID=G0L156_ZOBGA|nr:SGNH/GDSL hydrolase family protein [Zobellia galactanivorans]MBU3024174.1 SGNH/GDSL hydrolase family protein [Zobellia galactanivorans]CAZ97652.1 GDSL-like Lipase/Acylhydrolase family [Zobellia galactanivorans]